MIKPNNKHLKTIHQKITGQKPPTTDNNHTLLNKINNHLTNTKPPTIESDTIPLTITYTDKTQETIQIQTPPATKTIQTKLTEEKHPTDYSWRVQLTTIDGTPIPNQTIGVYYYYTDDMTGTTELVLRTTYTTDENGYTEYHKPHCEKWGYEGNETYEPCEIVYPPWG